jgi:hypothetical protein
VMPRESSSFLLDDRTQQKLRGPARGYASGQRVLWTGARA